MKILNLYSGIGGNRKLWGDNHEVTAVELKPDIAKIYKHYFPNDNLLIGDAHQYLLDNYERFDFIWSSPPCPTHSRLRMSRVKSDNLRSGNHCIKAKYPDMKLYEEIILLDKFFEGMYCVENVIGYYTPLIPPKLIGRHFYWTNFGINNIETTADNIEKGSVAELELRFGYDLSQFNLETRKITVLRNCVVPEIGKYILDSAMGYITKMNINQLEIF